MERIIVDSYSKQDKHTWGDNLNDEFNRRILAVNDMYRWLYDQGILEKVSFQFKDYEDATHFALDAQDLAPYRKDMENSGAKDAALAVYHIFDETYSPCQYSGAIELGWTMMSYRDVDGCVGRSWECGLVKSLNTEGIYEVLKVREEQGVKAAVNNLFGQFDWDPTLSKNTAELNAPKEEGWFESAFDRCNSESEYITSLRGEISNLRHELNGVFGYEHEDEWVPIIEKQLFVRECQLCAALKGIKLDHDSLDKMFVLNDGLIAQLEHAGSLETFLEQRGLFDANIVWNEQTQSFVAFRYLPKCADFGSLKEGLSTDKLILLEGIIEAYGEGRIDIEIIRDKDGQIDFDESFDLITNDENYKETGLEALAIKWYESFEDTGYLIDSFNDFEPVADEKPSLASQIQSASDRTAEGSSSQPPGKGKGSAFEI